MTQRLTQARLDEIERMELPKGKAVIAIAELLDEVHALRAELAGAEERGAAREREACANWLTLGEPVDEKLGAAVRRGDHVLWWESTGTTPPDAEDG